MSTNSALRDQFAPVAGGKVAPILVVDDHENTARAVAAYLTRAGFETVVANCGTDALKFADITCPAAALVDVHLSDLSGLVLTTKLRERMGKDRPILVLSGDTSMETLNSLSMVGANYFFSKPVNMRHVVERLEELLTPSADQPNSPEM